MPRQKTSNPFYSLLLIVGGVFAITACVYMVMTVRGLDPSLVTEDSESGVTLLGFMDEHGFTVLMVELGLLAVCTFAAIATDEMWGDKSAPDTAEMDANASDDHDAATDS